MHGDPYNIGDRVWLHSPVITPGKSKKFHHPWTGPYIVIKKLSDTTYRIQHHNKKNKRLVVHFDRLKWCHPDTRFSEGIIRSNTCITAQPAQISSIGENLELVDDYPDELPTRRYPICTRHPPNCFQEDFSF